MVKILEEHYHCKNSHKWLGGGVFQRAHLPALQGSWSQMAMGCRVNPSEALQAPGSSEQNHWAALLPAAVHLICLLFFLSNFSGFFPSVPLWKRLMWLAMERGLTWITNYSYTFEVTGLLYLPFRETLGFTDLLLFSANFSNFSARSWVAWFQPSLYKLSVPFGGPLWLPGSQWPGLRRVGQCFPTPKFATKL